MLINKERAMYETIELARLRIAGALGVAEGRVEAEGKVDDNGKVGVMFTVVDAESLGRPAEEIEQVIQSEYRAVRDRTYQRFVHLGDRWPHGSEETETGSAHTGAPEETPPGAD